MKREIKKGLSPEIKFHIIVAVAIAVFLLIAGAQKFTLHPAAGHDDGLYFTRAYALSEGHWLGTYNRLILAKNITYVLWMALWNALGVPLLWANAALFAGASYFMIFALRPLLSNWIARGAAFCLLLFNPITFSDVLMRTYRDSIAPAVILFVVGWVVGAFLRAARPGGTTLKKLLPFWILGCIFLPAWWFLREDGFWMAPFVIVGLALTFLFLFSKKRGGFSRKNSLGAVLLVLPILMTVLCGVGTATLNNAYYGRFVVNDYTSSDFEDAYGALTRVEHEALIMDVPVSEDARMKIYEVSPAFAELQPYLDNNGQTGVEGWKADLGDGKMDYKGGWFFWALRDAVSEAGYYETPSKAQEYYIRLADEVNAACDEGLLPAWAKKRSGITPPFHSEYLRPTARDTLTTFSFLVKNEGMNYATASASTTTVEQQKMIEDYIRWAGYQPLSNMVQLSFLVTPQDADAGKPDIQVQLVNATGEPFGDPQPISSGIVQNAWVDLPIDQNNFDYPADLSDFSVVLADEAGNSETLQLAGPDQLVQQSGDHYAVEMTLVDSKIGTPMTFYESAMRELQWAILAVYQILVPVLSIVSLVLLVGSFAYNLIRRRKVLQVPAIILAGGLLLTLLLRTVMLAFINVSSFPAINVLYLSSSYPLLLVFIILSVFVGISTILAELRRNRPQDMRPA